MQIRSPEIKNLAAALSAVQKQLDTAKKDKTNPHFRSKYADLTSVWEACREPLTNNGFSVTQTIHTIDTQLTLVTTLLHSSGEWVSSEFPMFMAKQDSQSAGSAVTYAKRYSLASLIGVCTSEDCDDDGEASQGRPNPPSSPKVTINGPKMEVRARSAPAVMPLESTTFEVAEFDRLTAEYPRASVEEYVRQSAGTKMTPDQIKGRAVKNFEGFLKVFKPWYDKNKAA